MFKVLSHQGNANQCNSEDAVNPSEWLRSKPQEIAHAGKGVEQGKYIFIPSGSTTTLKTNLVVSQKTGNSSSLIPTYTTPGHIPKRCSNIPQRHLLNYVHSIFICNSQKLQTTYMFLN